MSTKIIINKDLFSPHNERLLAVVQVKRRTKKKIPFLATGGQRNYLTYICLSVTERKPFRVSITKVKQFYGQSDFVKRSQWTIDQLQQVNGIDSSKDCPEFDLSFDNTVDQWVASSAGDKCTFIQVLHYSCQRYCLEKKPEFVNCQAKLLGESQAVDSVFFRCKVYLNRMKKEFMSHHGHLLRRGNSILHSAADSVTSAVQKASQALNERGERLGRAEERTADMMNSAEQFAVTAHKLAMKHKC